MIIMDFNPETYELSITGHANYNAKGKDIVCSAVSALFYALATSLANAKHMQEEEPTVIDNEDAETKKISCKPKKGYEANIELIYWTVLTGLDNITLSYPNCVKWAR